AAARRGGVAHHRRGTAGHVPADGVAQARRARPVPGRPAGEGGLAVRRLAQRAAGVPVHVARVPRPRATGAVGRIMRSMQTLPPLVEEAMKKAAIAWLTVNGTGTGTVNGTPFAVWC